MPTSKTRKTAAKKTTAKRAVAPRKVTSAKAWKKGRTDEPTELELPSGNVALVKRPGLEKMLAEDIFPDAIMGLAEQAVQKGKGKSPRPADDKQLMDLMQSRSKRSQMLDAFDRVTAFCVVEPICLYHRYTDKDDIPKGYGVGDTIPDEARDDDVIYTDDVDLEDKAHIFDFATGGSSDVEQFRGKLGEAVERLHSGEDVEV